MPPITRRISAQSGMVLLRMTLGIIILRTWVDNLDRGLYGAGGLEDFLDWLFSAEGNDSSLGFYQSFLDAIVVPVSGVYAKAQLVIELIIGIGLLLGVFTRLCSLAASLFFFNLFLAYFGGTEWIWTYVLLTSACLAVHLAATEQKWAIDNRLSEFVSPSSRLASLL